MQRARLLQLQRSESDHRSRFSEGQGELALARQRAGELQARIAQARISTSNRRPTRPGTRPRESASSKSGCGHLAIRRTGNSCARR